jgi:hypothetical protein
MTARRPARRRRVLPGLIELAGPGIPLRRYVGPYAPPTLEGQLVYRGADGLAVVPVPRKRRRKGKR